MLPSAYDVAHLAGVSQAAVSRAFTPGASIAKETRERVMSAARKLAYRPNLIARSLSMGRSGIIGVVLGIPENSAHIASFQALSARITKAGKHSMVFTTAGDDYIADVHIEDLLRYRVDALVLISANLSSKIAAECRAAEIPIIYLSRLTRPTEGMTSVTAAYAIGARKIAAHLVKQGYRRLAYMSGFSDTPTNRERESAFTQYLAAKRLPALQRILGHFKWEGAKAAARSVLSQRGRPDAIVCAVDYMALATIEVARYEFDIAVGAELGIAGFDDIEQASWSSFDLTTYSQPIETMVDHVMEILTQDPILERPTRIIVEGILKCRGSTVKG
jgi:DNA-binding LacI/PurR family transcriptional regulator